MVMPQEGELLGRVIKLVGGDNIIVKCTDGKVRTCRIRGKIKRRMWIRDADLVLVAPWDFQSQRADIIWRYISAHAEKMKADGLLQGLDWFSTMTQISIYRTADNLLLLPFGKDSKEACTLQHTGRGLHIQQPTNAIFLWKVLKKVWRMEAPAAAQGGKPFLLNT